jgi:predicted phage baseplate assembly protein
MTLPTPNLDDRKFQDIVDEAKKKIPQYCEEWTDHNVSDPGITLVELFAWMTENLLYRMNQVPDLHYIKFMEMLGIRLNGPTPARAPVTFWLSAPQEIPVTIPAHTEVATTQTETEPSIIFSTIEPFTVTPPKLAAVLSQVAGESEREKRFIPFTLRHLEAGFDGTFVFTETPQVNDAFYFGFDNDLSNHVLRLEMDFDTAGGTGIDPTMPPYDWEASAGGSGWEKCDEEIDTTRGMNTTGRIQVHLPKMSKDVVNDKEAYWVRVRIHAISQEFYDQGARPYHRSPRIRKAKVTSIGGRVIATHSQKVTNEYLGQSDGTPGQRFQLKNKPVLDRGEGEQLIVKIENQATQAWKEVPNFSSSGSSDRHYTLDSITGEIRFGPAVRQQDGTIKLYGAVPTRKASLVFQQYHFGGGQIGNVQQGIINTLKTAIPYIARVSNRRPASGGLDAETLESARMRVPAILRSRERAVTESDFEYIASQAQPSRIGRVRCLQPGAGTDKNIQAGQVYILVVPRISNADRFLGPDELDLDDETANFLKDYLDQRRMLTTRLLVRPPTYTWVAVKVKLRGVPGASQESIRGEVLQRLYRFLNPLTGGGDGKGWPFGRTLFASDVYQSLQDYRDIQFVRSLEIFSAKPGGEAQGEPLEVLEVPAQGVIASGKHQVEFV